LGVISCPNCGEENPAKFRLCGFCGAPLAPQAPPQELRKLVTILFCDLKGSTNLGEALDPESLREVMARYFEVMSAAINRHGGTIEKYIGDAVMAVFGLPRVHEDDALRAVRAAQAMQDGLRELNIELERAYGVTLANRIGVNTGEVVAGDAATRQRLVTGDAVNVAARLEQAAGDTETLLGELTLKLVRGVVEVEPVEPLTLKGKSEPVPAYRLVSIRDAFANDPLAERQQLVGRRGEVDMLLASLDEAVAAEAPRLIVVLGEGGVGKTRLIDEFTTAVGPAALALRGRCLSYGDGITFWPLVEAIRAGAGVTDADQTANVLAKLEAFVGPGDAEVVERLGAVMGLSATPYPLPEIFWAIRRLLEILARRKPVVLVIEDLHWAEPTLLDLIDSLHTAPAKTSALIVAAARPEVLEKQPSLAERPVLTLERLSPDDSARMVEDLLGAPIEPAALERIVTAADGNPLFAQQLVSMLKEEKLLTLDAGTWRLAALPEGWIPPTINALLSARIDRLEREDRAVLDPASVVGHLFPLAAVTELSDDVVKDQVPARIERLTQTWYVKDAPERGPDFRQFHHIFIRDSVYESLLKRQRATLHERFVQWADRVNGDRAVEYEEILGYHLEQAHRFLLELAPADDHARAIGADGAGRLASAGRRAFMRGDMPAAANLLRRATLLLEQDDPKRLGLLPDLAEALMQIGEFEAAGMAVGEARDAADVLGDPRLAGGARIVGELVRLFSTSAGDWSEQASATVDEVVEGARQLEDHVTLARAHRLLAWVNGKGCRYGAAGAALGRAIEHAQRADDVRQERRASTAYALVSALGPTPVEEAVLRCGAVAERVAGDRQAEGAVLSVTGLLEAMRGSFDLARSLCTQARYHFEELGLRVEAGQTVLESSRVELLAGDPAAAEQDLRRGFRVLEELRERYFLSTLSGLLARALWEQGKLDDAENHTALAEELSDADDIDAQVTWRCVHARILAVRGEADAAEALARGAVEMLRSTDAVLLQIEALVALADVHALTGRPGADEARRDARALALAKGSLVLAAYASNTLNLVGASEPG
jgi:class 3 adenylate cyclase/tetratricopeptide (TPR) repeat protein